MNRKLSIKGRIIICLCAVLLAAGYVYVGYGIFTGTGLVGYLIRLQLDLFGSAWLKLTYLVALGLLALPPALLIPALKKFAPSLMFRPTESKPSASAASGPVVSGYTGWLTNLSWKTVFGYAAVMLMLTAAAYAPMVYLAHEQQQEKVYEIDLTSGSAAPSGELPRGAKSAEIAGVMAREYARVYTEGTIGSPDTYQMFAPLTGSGWNPSDAVRYFIHIKAHRTRDGEPQWPEAFRQAGPAKFAGQLGRSLPLFVESDYKSKALKISSPYLVVDWREMPDHSIPPSDDQLIVLSVGLLFSVSTLLTLAAIKINKKDILKRRRQAGFD